MRPPFHSLAIAAVLSGSAHAAVVNFDFTAGAVPVTQSGLAAAPDVAGSSAYWNAVRRDGSKDKVESIPLLDSAGQSTSVALSLGVNGAHDSAGLGDQESAGSGGGPYAGLMGDYMFLDAGGAGLVSTMSGTLTGLAASNYYDIYFYGQGDKFTGNIYRGQNTLFTVDGVSKQTSWDGTPGGDGLLVEGFEYVKFTVQADADGKIHFSWSNVVAGLNVPIDADGYSTRYAAFNGMQIAHNPDAVPEPSVMLLGIFGMFGLLRRRR